jgi:hypothetical protein
MSVQTMMDRVFYLIGDSGRQSSNSTEVLFALNSAQRELRRQILDYKPSLLYETETGNTVAGTAEYTLTYKPLRIITVRVSGYVIPAIRKEDITDLTTTGNPIGYYMTATNKIALYPIPTEIVPYEVMAVRSATAWTEASTTEWVDEVEDGLADWAAAFIAKQPLPTMPLMIIIGNIEKELPLVGSYWGDSDYARIRTDY